MSKKTVQTTSGNPAKQNGGSRPNRTAASRATRKRPESPLDSRREALYETLIESRKGALRWSRQFDALLAKVAEEIPEESEDRPSISSITGMEESRASVLLQLLDRYLTTSLKLHGAIHSSINLELKVFGGSGRKDA